MEWWSGAGQLATEIDTKDSPMVDSEAEVPEGAEHTIEQGRALVRAVESLGVIEPTAWFERAIARLLLAAYKRRPRAIIGAVPAWMGDRILQASERISDPEAALFTDN
jgi:hypothetical protein